MRPAITALSGLLLSLGLAACDDIEMDDAPMRTGSSADEAACAAAVNRNYGASVATVMSSDFSQANTEVMLMAQGERWRCLSSGGVVADLAVVG